MNPNPVHQIESLLPLLSAAEKLQLIAHMVRDLIEQPPQPPRDLRGIWKDKFPPDVDIDSTLKEIRSGWEEDQEATARV
jgi:hypothetical protein